MELLEFVEDVLERGAHGTSLPDTLTLPVNMAGTFLSLYKKGEEHAREFGHNLTYEAQTRSFVFSDIYSGDKTSTPLRTMSHFENCADVHCHPTASIGEAEGYSPHSPEDFLSLGEQIQRGKPLYIKFVVSGNHIYAVVYRRGLSTFDATAIYLAKGDLEEAQQTYFAEHCAYSAEERMELLSRAREQQDLDDLDTRFKSATKGYGENQMDHTFRACEKIAHLLKLGFYAGIGHTLKRMA